MLNRKWSEENENRKLSKVYETEFNIIGRTMCINFDGKILEHYEVKTGNISVLLTLSDKT